MNAWNETITEPLRAATTGFSLTLPNADVLMPIAVICGVSLLLTVLWTLGVCEYTWIHQRRPSIDV